MDMSNSDHSQSFVLPSPFPNGGVDSMGFWPQFPAMSNEQSECNGHFDYNGPPFKRNKNSDDDSQASGPYPPLNRRDPLRTNSEGKMFFKTRLCAKFRTGQCRNGENCNFAHGEEDLRNPPPNWQEIVAGRSGDRGTGNWEDDERLIHRMKLCKKFYNGEECPYGDRCNFLHKEPATFRDNPVRFRESNSRESSAISIGTNTGPPVMQGNGSDQYAVNRVLDIGLDLSKGNLRAVYWKTKICVKWEATGHCPFGEKCHYAHGLSELQRHSVEGDLMNSNPVVAKPAPPAFNEPMPTGTVANHATGAALNQEGQGKKCFLKWKGTKKINRIYADWIDDLPLNLPNEVEG